MDPQLDLHWRRSQECRSNGNQRIFTNTTAAFRISIPEADFYHRGISRGPASVPHESNATLLLLNHKGQFLRDCRVPRCGGDG
jgi:hypothetical protein